MPPGHRHGHPAGLRGMEGTGARYLGREHSEPRKCLRFPFEEGREYLVYAYGKHDLKVDLCRETRPLSIAEADLGVLGNGEKPKSSDALTDTSGSFRCCR